MIRLRPILTVAAFAVCLGITVATAVTVLVRGIPREPPMRAGVALPGHGPTVPRGELPLREELLSQDVAELPKQQQRRLAARLEAMLAAGDAERLFRPELTDEGRQRLQANLAELAVVWVLEKSQQYSALPRLRREAFLDAHLEPWLRLVPSFKGQGDARELTWPYAIDPAVGLQMIQQRIAKLQPMKLRQAREFLSALARRAKEQVE